MEPHRRPWVSPHGTIAAGVVERRPALIACLAALLASALILLPAAGDRFDTGGTGAAGIPADPLQPLIGLATDAGAAAPAGRPAAVSGEVRRREEVRLQRAYARVPLELRAQPRPGRCGGRLRLPRRRLLALARADEAMLVLSEGSSSRETVDAAAHPAADGLALGMRLLGADPKARAEPLDRLPGEVNYLVGERADWRTGIPTYERVRYHSAWPGIRR